MELPEQAELVQKFMLAIAPEMTRFTLHQFRGPNWPSQFSEEALSEQRRTMCNLNARMTLELAVHLAAQAASVNHAAKDAPAPKDPAQEQVEATALQQRAFGKATT